MATPQELLETHKPVLKYDSQESYVADSAAEWTDNPGNRLVKTDGSVVASQGGDLSLSFLGTTYPDGTPASATDVISDPSKRYEEQARALHQQPGYANRMYGHAVYDGTGALWLQYWFFYFYNDYNLIGHIIRAGLHEGDWEMIQIRLPRARRRILPFTRSTRPPTRATGGRSTSCQARSVHSSTSHADRTRATSSPAPIGRAHWFDVADGKRKSPEVELEVVDEADPGWRWIRWPGHWGDTKAAGKPVRR